MKIDNHVENLKKKHHEVDLQLRENMLHHERDENIHDLKRQKLIIKDQLEALIKKIEDVK